MTKKENFMKGIISENPLFVSILGTCPALGVTSTLVGSLGMGIAFTIILVISNFVISLARKIIPDEVRIPSYIVIIATITSVIQLLMAAYLESVYTILGIFLPLIVVNCNLLGRAEAYAAKNTPTDSIIDGLGMGVGFTLALLTMGLIREVLGSGEFFGLPVFEKINLAPIGILAGPTGAFLTLGICIWAFNAFRAKLEAKQVQE